MLFMMRSGHRPFVEAKTTDLWYKYIYDEKYEVFWKMHGKDKPEGLYSEEFQKIVNGMLEADPTKRFKIENIIASPWHEEKEGKSALEKLIAQEIGKLEETLKQLNQSGKLKTRETRRQQAQALDNGMFQGVRTYRGMEDVGKCIDLAFSDVAEELETEGRTIKIKPEKQKNECVFDFYVDLQFLFKCLAFAAQTYALEWNISKTAYQINGTFQAEGEDSGNPVELAMKIYQLEFEGEYAVEFIKLKGDYWDFLTIVQDKLVKKITELTK